MKNLMYFLLCDIIIVALVMLTSCDSQGGGACEKTYEADIVTYNDIMPESIQKPAKYEDFSDAQKRKTVDVGQEASGLSFSSKRDTSTLRARMSEKAQKNLIRWSISGGL